MVRRAEHILKSWGDGWILWPEDDTGTPRQPDLGELNEGETIESRYDYDAERLIRAWSRKVVESDASDYGFACTGCGTGLLVVPCSPPLVPYQTDVERITCPACGESNEYCGQMIRVPIDPLST